MGPLSISNEATRIYSTWFSLSPRGYCDRSFLLGCASGLYFRGAERDECCEDTPLDGVFEVELGSEFRSVSIMGGLGDLDGLECRLIAEGEREEGNEDSEVLRFAGALPLELQVDMVSVVPAVPLVVGRCIAALVAFVLRYIGTVEAMVVRSLVPWSLDLGLVGKGAVSAT
jgi:hypothetical protein